jgi:phage protein D
VPTETLYLSTPKVEIDGQKAPPDLIKDLVQIVVEESLHLPAMFTLVIHNSYISTNNTSTHQEWRHDKYLKMGSKIKIGFVSSTTQDIHFKDKNEGMLIEGEITSIEVNFTEKSEAPIVVRGYDFSHRLHRGRHNRSFLNKTDSDIVKEIASEAKISIGKIDSSGEPHDYVFQENQTNMEFLRERAAYIGFELFIQDGKLYFRKPDAKQTLSLEWLKSISKFNTRIASAEQVNEVEVRSWDYQQKKVMSASAKTEKVTTETGNNKGSNTASKFPVNSKLTVVDRPVFKQKHADQIAQALCDELGGEYVYGDAHGEGNPEIRSGKIVQLNGMGDRFSGKYYITETRHLYSARVYKTDFSVRGLRGGNLFTTLSPSTKLQPGQTFLVGIVTDNKDPQGWGRVKVKLPTLTEAHTSNWARVVAAGAGPNRGFDCLPEINDEVLVGFEHGDIHRPYILGGVWNGKDAPSEKVGDSIQGGKVRLRTMKTRTGHTLQFVEEDKGSSKAGVRVETTKGHKIYFNDSDACIEISTAGGHKIKLDDRGKSISIDSSGGHKVKLNDANKSISIDSSGGHKIKLDDIGMSISVDSVGNLSLKATGNIDINANGIITLKGAMIRLN